MIQLNNQVYFRMDFGNIEDVVGPETAVDVSIAERLGNDIPCAAVTLDFASEIQDYMLHELTSVNMVIGFSEDVAAHSRWQVAGHRKSAGGFVMALTSNRDYVNVSGYKAYKNKDSVGAIKDAVKEYFCIEDADGKSTLEASNYNDKMTWLRREQTAREFVDSVWLHSYKAGSLMVPGITGNILGKGEDKFGTFRLIDLYQRNKIIELRRDSKDAEVSVDDGTPMKDTTLMSDDAYASSSALFNYRVGSRKLNQFDVDTADGVCKPVDSEPIFKGVFNAAPQAKDNDGFYGKSSVRAYAGADRFVSGNVHKHYHEAAILNMNRLSKFGGTSKMLQIADRRKVPIMVGDFVRVHSLIPGTSMNSEVQSGDYVVTGVLTKVVSNPQTRAFAKTLLLNRDALDIQEYDGFFKPPK